MSSKRPLWIVFGLLLLLSYIAHAQAPQTQAVRSTAAAPAYTEGTYNPFSTDLSGRLRVLSTVSPAGTQDVNLTQIGGIAAAAGNGLTNTGTLRVTLSSDSTGQVTANQGGTWTVQPGNTANTTAWLVTGTGGTFPATQSGTWSVRTQDGAGATISSAANALFHIIRDAAGNLRGANVNASNQLSVSVDNTATVSGTVTANQGTANATPWNVNAAQVGGNATNTGNGLTGTGTLRVTLSSDSTGQVALAAGSNTIGALTANQSVNVAQLAGAATATNTGLASLGTLRVVLATDQPQLTNKLLVTPDANSAVNVAQVNGVATTTGNGISGTGVQRVTIASDSTGQVALAAGSATIGALTANQSVNVAQMAGTATAVNTGLSSAGTLRVVLATDQPQLTNKLLVTPDANSAVNVAQVNGVATSTGNGVSGTGVQRVTIASDSTGQVALAAGSATIGALTANQSVNLAQVGGSSTATGSGTSYTGVARVTVVSGTPILANALAATVVTVNGAASIWDSYQCVNPDTSNFAYIQVFDISGTVTLGTSTPKWSMGIPPLTEIGRSDLNLNFANAIKVAATTTPTGSTAAVTAVNCNFGYR